MITLLFTTNTGFFSSVCRWACDEDCTHFAVGFDLSQPKGLVFHSNIKGGSVDFKLDFYQHNKIIHKIGIAGLSLQTEEQIFQFLISKAYQKNYDKKGWSFFAIKILLKKVFKTPLPEVNEWQEEQKFLCTEIYKIIQQALPDKLPPIDKISITTPHQLYLELSKWFNLKAK